jgi:hypothetical protein
VQPVLAVFHVPLNPAAQMQPVWLVAPSVVDPPAQVVQPVLLAAALKLSRPHATHPVLAPPKPATHTQPACPVKPLVVDPVAHLMQLPEPAKALYVF